MALLARENVVNKFDKDSVQGQMLTNICYDEYESLTTKLDTATNESSDWNVIRQHLLNISQPCNEMLLKCRFALETFNCMDLFDTVLSDEGPDS